MKEPQWDDDLPRDKEELEREMDVVASEIATGERESSVVENPDGSCVVHMGPRAIRLMRLRRQMFRAEFGREPGDDDPIFWERNRDGEPEPIDVDRRHLSLVAAARAAQLDPAMTYALGVIGLPMTKDLRKMRPKLARWWDACVGHYRRCANTKWAPVIPAELRTAILAMNFASTHPIVHYEASDSVAPGVPEEHRRLLGAVLDALKDERAAEIALTRISIMAVTIGTDHESGYSERLMYAAATARVKGVQFDKKSFKEQLYEYDRYEGTP